MGVTHCPGCSGWGEARSLMTSTGPQYVRRDPCLGLPSQSPSVPASWREDWADPAMDVYDAALPSEPPSDPHPLDDTLRVIGALAHEASRDHEKAGCVVCVAARPVLAALSEPVE